MAIHDKHVVKNTGKFKPVKAIRDEERHEPIEVPAATNEHDRLAKQADALLPAEYRSEYRDRLINAMLNVGNDDVDIITKEIKEKEMAKTSKLVVVSNGHHTVVSVRSEMPGQLYASMFGFLSYEDLYRKVAELLQSEDDVNEVMVLYVSGQTKTANEIINAAIAAKSESTKEQEMKTTTVATADVKANKILSAVGEANKGFKAKLAQLFPNAESLDQLCVKHGQRGFFERQFENLREMVPV